MSGKQSKRERRELDAELRRFSLMRPADIVAMVTSGELPFHIAMQMELHGKNREEVINALREVAKPGDIEVREVKLIRAAPPELPVIADATD